MHAFRLRSAQHFLYEAERHDDRHCHGARAGDCLAILLTKKKDLAEMGQKERSWECGLYILVKLLQATQNTSFSPQNGGLVREISLFQANLGW